MRVSSGLAVVSSRTGLDDDPTVRWDDEVTGSRHQVAAFGRHIGDSSRRHARCGTSGIRGRPGTNRAWNRRAVCGPGGLYRDEHWTYRGHREPGRLPGPCSDWVPARSSERPVHHPRSRRRRATGQGRPWHRVLRCRRTVLDQHSGVGSRRVDAFPGRVPRGEFPGSDGHPDSGRRERSELRLGLPSGVNSHGGIGQLGAAHKRSQLVQCLLADRQLGDAGNELRFGGHHNGSEFDHA
jgi:hypothetical protein